MPRIRKLTNEYVKEDFIKEIRKKMIDINYASVAEVAQVAHVAERTLYRKIQMPETFRVRDLQKIVQILNPDPGILLALLGYTQRDIKRFKEK